jgi:hypothetical protein
MPESLYRVYAELQVSLTFLPLTKKSLEVLQLANATAVSGRDPEFYLRFILAGFYNGYRTGNQNLPHRTFATGLHGSGIFRCKKLLEMNYEISI